MRPPNSPSPTETAASGEEAAATPSQHSVELQQWGQQLQQRGRQLQQRGLRGRAGARAGARAGDPGGWPGAAISTARGAGHGPVGSCQAERRRAVAGRCLPRSSQGLRGGPRWRQGSGQRSLSPLRDPQRWPERRGVPTLHGHSALELRGAGRRGGHGPRCTPSLGMEGTDGAALPSLRLVLGDGGPAVLPLEGVDAPVLAHGMFASGPFWENRAQGSSLPCGGRWPCFPHLFALKAT